MFLFLKTFFELCFYCTFLQTEKYVHIFVIFCTTFVSFGFRSLVFYNLFWVGKTFRSKKQNKTKSQQQNPLIYKLLHSERGYKVARRSGCFCEKCPDRDSRGGSVGSNIFLSTSRLGSWTREAPHRTLLTPLRDGLWPRWGHFWKTEQKGKPSLPPPRRTSSFATHPMFTLRRWTEDLRLGNRTQSWGVLWVWFLGVRPDQTAKKRSEGEVFGVLPWRAPGCWVLGARSAPPGPLTAHTPVLPEELLMSCRQPPRPESSGC